MMCLSLAKHSPTSELLLWITSTTAAILASETLSLTPLALPSTGGREAGAQVSGQQCHPSNSRGAMHPQAPPSPSNL